MTSLRIEKFARAAMLGLLAATQSACTVSSESGPNTSEDNEDDPTDMTGDGDEDDATGGSSGGEPGNTGGAETGDPGGDGGVGGSVMGVISTEIIPDLTLEEFTEMCEKAAGQVEIHSHCGGVVTGKGFSYDSDTDAFTEHTCAGYNTCTGFSCVIDD